MIIDKQKNNISDMPKCEPIKIYASTVRKNIVNKYVTIMLL